MHCQDCGHQFIPDYNGGTVVESCPNCSSYRLIPTPVHSDMGVRDMPGPAASGLEDSGGNPLKEGILADGGWQNRMKRDESFASVKTADGNPYQPTPNNLDRDIYDFMRQNPTRREEPQGFSLWNKAPNVDAEEFRLMMAEDPRRAQELVHKFPQLQALQGFQTGDQAPQSEEWRGGPSEPGGQGWRQGAPGRGLITADDQIHTWPEDQATHWDYMDRHGLQDHDVATTFGIDPTGQVNIHGWNADGPHPVLPHHEELLRNHGLTMGQPDEILNDEDAWTASTRSRYYLPWTADTKSIDADFDVTQVVPPGPHTVEVNADGEMNPVILQHDNPQILDEAKTQLQSSRQAGLIGSLLGGVGGFMMGGPLGALRGASLGNMLGNALGGGAQQPANPGQGATQIPVAQLASIHAQVTAEYEHPSSNPRYEDTDDPEDVDQHEHNVGEHPPETDDGQGSDHFPDIPLDSDIGQAFQEALPALIKYYDSDESGAHDPAIAKLVDLVESQHPGLINADHPIDDEDLQDIMEAKGQHTAAGVPGIGMTPAVAPPGGGVNGQVPANPMSTVPCPHCGALGPGMGQCTQCGNVLTPAPNTAPQGVVPPVPGPGYPQQQPMPGVVAANQGPHNAPQFQAVADFLTQNGRADEIPNMIAHPEMYSQELAAVAQKQAPVEPDPDPGAPPPAPAMPGMDPSAGAPPMPMPTGKVAYDEGDSQIGFDGDVEQSHHHPWVDQSGMPLQIGKSYEMYTDKYDIPDVIRVDAVKPTAIEYTLLGEYGLEHKTELTKDEADSYNTTFLPDPDDQPDNPDETDVDGQGDQRGVVVPQNQPAFASTKQGADSTAPKCPKCDSHTTETLVDRKGDVSFSCHNCRNLWKEDVATTTSKVATPVPTVIPGALYPEEEKLQSANYPHERDGEYIPCPHCGEFMKPALNGCPHCGNSLSFRPPVTAGAKFTPMEQREFIDEPGVARNRQKMDLSHTHYEQSGLSDDFLFGL